MPIHFAAERGHAAVVQLLLDRGADIHASDNVSIRDVSFDLTGYWTCNTHSSVNATDTHEGLSLWPVAPVCLLASAMKSGRL